MTTRFGVSYRPEWGAELAGQMDHLDCFEIILEQVDLLEPALLKRLGARPIVLHSVSLSAGSAEPLPADRLNHAREVVRALKPDCFSVHMAVTEVSGLEFSQLTPVLFTPDNVAALADNLCALRDHLRTDILLENIACYFEPWGDGRREWDMMAEVVERADCGILLDLNNLHVNSRNLGFAAADFLDGIPVERVRQVHLAGFEPLDGLLLDSHGQPTSPEVFALLQALARRTEVAMVIVERDSRIPPLSEIITELDEARRAVRRGRAEAKPTSECAPG
jgi:hypothetical protein